IHASLEWRTYLSPHVSQEVLQLLFGPVHRSEQQAARYLSYKGEILQLLAEGQTLSDVASALNLSLSAIEGLTGEMMRAFGVQTTGDFARLACRMGLVAACPIERTSSAAGVQAYPTA